MFGEGKKNAKVWLRVDDELNLVLRAVAKAKGWQIQDTARRLMALGAQQSARQLGQRIPDQIRLMASNAVQR
jgi:hypothetical protein